MDQETSTKILRLSRLEKRAAARLKHALESGSTRRAMRAADLVMAVHARWGAIMGAEVTAYQE